MGGLNSLAFHQNENLKYSLPRILHINACWLRHDPWGEEWVDEGNAVDVVDLHFQKFKLTTNWVSQRNPRVDMNGRMSAWKDASNGGTPGISPGTVIIYTIKTKYYICVLCICFEKAKKVLERRKKRRKKYWEDPNSLDVNVYRLAPPCGIRNDK